MKRTVSKARAPEYPTASVNPDYFRQELAEAQDSLEDQGFDQAFRLQLKVAAPPIDYRDEIVDMLESNAIYARIDGSNGDFRRNEQISLEYRLNVPDNLNETLESIESAVRDAGYEKKFWKLDGVYSPMEGGHDERVDNIIEYARSMQIHPNLLVDAGIDSSITIGWFAKAPLSSDVQFGYRAFPNREFEDDTLQDGDEFKILERITGNREDGINNHSLSEEETSKLLELEHSMGLQGLL